MPIKVEVGARFHRLLVVGLIPDRKNPKALCLCDCGKLVTPQRGALRNGRAKSCGCLRVELFNAIQAGRPRMDAAEAKRRRDAAIDKWHKAHPEKNRAASRRHYANNKARVKSYHHQRRARLKGAKVGIYDTNVEHRLWVIQRGKCAVCKCDLKRSGHHVDHIEPIAAGGRHENRNLQLLCPACNLSKGATDPIAFMQRRGFLL